MVISVGRGGALVPWRAASSRSRVGEAGRDVTEESLPS